MVKDNPSDDIFNYFYDIIFSGHPLSLKILGTKKSLGMLDSHIIRKYFDVNFSLNGIVLSAAGNIEHDRLVEMVSEKMEGISFIKRPGQEKGTALSTRVKGLNKVYNGKTEASHICYGGPGCNRASAERYPLSLFANILGGSISSRLFQKIREEKGLSYTIFASNTQYTDAGVIAIYAATSPAGVGKVIDLINTEIYDIEKNGIKPEELDIAKENTKGNIVLSVEDISSRMFRLGKALLMDGAVNTIDDILKRIDKVKIEEVNDIVGKYFNPERMSLVVIGKPSNGRAK